jgi:hypothetical protein
MAITGTGTGPFTITGTETTINIYNFVVAANAANATKNAANTQFTFLCPLIVGNGTTTTLWNPTEQEIEISTSSFNIAVNATVQCGTPNGPRAGCYFKVNVPADAWLINGTLNAYASRMYSQSRVRANTGAVVYLEDCNNAFLDSIDNNFGTQNPTISYVRGTHAGASAVAVKLGGNMTIEAPRVYNATYAFQASLINGGAATYTIKNYVGVNNTNDIVPNAIGSTVTNIVGAYDTSGNPRSSLIIAMPDAQSISRLQWTYDLTATANGTALPGAAVRIRRTVGIPSTVFSGTTNSIGKITQQILTRWEYLGSTTGSQRYPYLTSVRTYNKASQELVYNADNHAAQSTAHVPIVTPSLTQAQAAALIGITLTPTPTTVSVESIVNGTFDADTAWTKGGGVTISGGAANCTGAGYIVGQMSDLTIGASYTFTLSYTKSAGSALRISSGASDGTNVIFTSAALANGSGTITFTFTAARQGLVIGGSGAIFSGTIDNVSCTTSYSAVLPNNGALSISSSKSIDDVWSFWRNFISTLANFDSADTWDYDGAVLNTGAWTASITGGTVSLGTLVSPTIAVSAGAIVSAGLTGPVTNAGTVSGNITGNVVNSGTLSGRIIGNVVNTGTIASGATITGNLTQNTPTNMTGVTVTGDLIYEPAAQTTITLTNVTHVGNIINNGTAPLVIVLAGTTTIGTAGSNISVQVLCSVAVNGGNTFNLVKRYGTTGNYTDLGYSAGLTTDTFLVPKGQPVEVAIWTLGYLTFTRTIQTTNGGFSLLADMIPEPDVDTSLNVSAYLANISVTYASGTFTATFNANMSVPGIEPAKAILHRLLGLEGSMRALLPPGMSTTVDVEPDEIQINKPAVFLVLGAGATDVSIAGFFNTGPAKVIDPAYIINPRRVSDNLRVEIPLVKPAIDADLLASAVQAKLAEKLALLDAAISTRSTLAAGAAMTLTAAYDAAKTAATQTSVTNLGSPAQATALATLATNNQAEHDATQTAIAALPAAPTAAANAAATRTELAPELAQVTKVAKLHGIGASLVVTPTTRVAGTVSQSITTEGTTTTVAEV